MNYSPDKEKAPAGATAYGSLDNKSKVIISNNMENSKTLVEGVADKLAPSVYKLGLVQSCLQAFEDHDVLLHARAMQEIIGEAIAEIESI